MNALKTIAAVVLLGGGGAAVGFLAARRGEAPPAPPAASALPQQQAELGRLAVQAMASARPRPEVAAEPAPAPSADEAPAARVPTPTPREEAEWIAARAKGYDEALAREPRNEAWAAPLERMMRAAYPSSSDGTRLLNVECRTHVCRVEIETREGADRTEELRAVASRIPELPNGSYAYPGEPDSHRQAVIYMMRDGHLLPRLDYTAYAARVTKPAP